MTRIRIQRVAIALAVLDITLFVLAGIPRYSNATHGTDHVIGGIFWMGFLAGTLALLITPGRLGNPRDPPTPRDPVRRAAGRADDLTARSFRDWRSMTTAHRRTVCQPDNRAADATPAPRRVLVVLALLCAVSILGACSDAAQPTSPSSPTSRSSSRPSVTPVTKTAFMARANALCTKSNKKLENAARTAFGSQRPTTQTWRPFMVDVVLPIVEHRLHDLGELPAPTGDQAAVTSITNTGRAAVDTATHNPHILSPLSRAPFDHFDELAIAYGIPGCAVGG